MKLLRRKMKDKNRKNWNNSKWFQDNSIFVKHVWDFFRPCPVVFKVNLAKFNNPCRNDTWRDEYTPAKMTIGGHDWWSWLRETDLPGKVKVDFYFHGWYSTFMHADPKDGIYETADLYISFSNKAAAMMFKLNFASPELELIFPG